MTKRTSTATAPPPEPEPGPQVPETVTAYVVTAPGGAHIRGARSQGNRGSVINDQVIPAGQLLPRWVPTETAEHMVQAGIAQAVTLPRRSAPRPPRVRPADDPALAMTANARPVRTVFKVKAAAVVFRAAGNAGAMLYRGARVPDTIHPDDRDRLEQDGLIERHEKPLSDVDADPEPAPDAHPLSNL